MALDREYYRSDVVLGAEALRLAVDSFGETGAPSDEAVLTRSKSFYRWLVSENKR